MTPWFLTAGGLAMLLIAGDLLVKGAVNMSLRLGIPALIVSLTIVAFGTSAPELLISVQAVIEGAPGLALGNVVGSNIANVLLVLAVPALVATLHTSQYDTRDTYQQMIGATVLFIGLCFFGRLTWMSGLVLLAALAAMLWRAARSANDHRKANGDANPSELGINGLDWSRIAIYLIVGLVGLPVGAHFMVEGSTQIARDFGVSDGVIGLTLVAAGTSLPELATTAMAALRRQADVALGNVIGSNMFNLLGILGLASLVGTIPVDAQFLRFELWVMLGSALVLVPFVYFRRDITRLWGMAMAAAYIIFLWIVVT